MGKGGLTAGILAAGMAFATGGASLLGTAATTAGVGGATATAAATAGMFGTAGSFSALTTLGTVGTFGSSFGGMMSAGAAYDESIFNKKQQDLKTKSIEIKAKQEANAIREKTIQDLSKANALFGARGVGSNIAAGEEILRTGVENVSQVESSGSLDILQSRSQANQFAGATKYAGSGSLAKTASLLGK